MNIVLVGFRCAGKSSVGKSLAEKLKRTFVDCDEYIERKTHLSIREIFDIAGESHFRLLESDALAELAKGDGVVIATGGGAVLRYKNIRTLKRNSVVVFLEVGADSAFERLTQDPTTKTRRPPLTGKDVYSEIKEQVEFRRPYYQSAADVIVRTDGKSVDDIVKEIVSQLDLDGPPPAPGEPPPEEPPDDQDAQLA